MQETAGSMRELELRSCTAPEIALLGSAGIPKSALQRRSELDAIASALENLALPALGDGGEAAVHFGFRS